MAKRPAGPRPGCRAWPAAAKGVGLSSSSATVRPPALGPLGSRPEATDLGDLGVGDVVVDSHSCVLPPGRRFPCVVASPASRSVASSYHLHATPAARVVTVDCWVSQCADDDVQELALAISTIPINEPTNPPPSAAFRFLLRDFFLNPISNPIR